MVPLSIMPFKEREKNMDNFKKLKLTIIQEFEGDLTEIAIESLLCGMVFKTA